MRNLLLVMLVAGAVNTQAQSWKTYYDSTEVYWNKDWSKCISLLESALPLAAEQIGKNSGNYLVLMNDLGLAYLENGDHQMAEGLFLDLLESKKAKLGVNSAEYAATQINLAGIYQELGKGSQAETLYPEAIQNLEISLGDDHADYATAIQNLGRLYESEARFTQAEALYLDAIEIRKMAI